MVYNRVKLIFAVWYRERDETQEIKHIALSYAKNVLIECEEGL